MDRAHIPLFNPLTSNQQLEQELAQLRAMTAAGVTGASGADGSDAAGVAYLTPDALMAYCQSRLSSIDTQVQTAMAQQQMHNAETGDLQSLLGQLQAHAGGVGSNGNPQKATCEDIEKAMAAEIMKLKAEDPGNPELGKLTQTYNDLVWSGTGEDENLRPDPKVNSTYIDKGDYPPNTTGGKEGDGVLGDSEMQGYVQQLQGMVNDLNSGAELQMIQLQSLMSQRQTAVQLTTNLVQSLGDQQNKIVDNIGH